MNEEDNDTCYSIECIAVHILRIARESLMKIYYYGRKRRQHERNASVNIMFTGELPGNAIMGIFDQLHLRSSTNDLEHFRILIIPEVCFEGYRFAELPPNVGER